MTPSLIHLSKETRRRRSSVDEDERSLELRLASIRESDVCALISPWFSPTVQPRETAVTPNAYGNNKLMPHSDALRKTAAQILQRGGLSVSLMHVASRVYQLLMVDVNGVPLVGSIAVLKSLILDSWIVASNTLAPVAGQVRPENAIVRGLIMLLAKRLIGIKQLGAVREVLTLLNLVKLASDAMVATKFHTDVAVTLNQIASLPMLFYTALARIAVDSSAKSWLSQFPNAGREAMVTFKIDIDAKGQIGKNGAKLRKSWEQTLDRSPELRAYVARHQVRNQDQAIASLSEFARLLA